MWPARNWRCLQGGRKCAKTCCGFWKNVAKRAVTKEYTISQSEFLARTRNINHFVRESSGEITVSFGYAGCVIPLTKFNTRINGSGQVVTQVKRSSAAEVLDHSF